MVPADIRATLHRQRSFGGVCPHGILSPRKSILMAIRTAFSNSGHPLSSLRGDGVELWTDAQFEKVSAPELNDNYEELLELWEKLKAKYARV